MATIRIRRGAAGLVLVDAADRISECPAYLTHAHPELAHDAIVGFDVHIGRSDYYLGRCA